MFTMQGNNGQWTYTKAKTELGISSELQLIPRDIFPLTIRVSEIKNNCIFLATGFKSITFPQ